MLLSVTRERYPLSHQEPTGKAHGAEADLGLRLAFPMAGPFIRGCHLVNHQPVACAPLCAGTRGISAARARLKKKNPDGRAIRACQVLGGNKVLGLPSLGRKQVLGGNKSRAETGRWRRRV
ncbi:hypothetical protein CHELA40_10907 [Chelatococcus asaccharovorans]|nr:hypothetical protein CHELA40_10907 [Chelatococcus asaccharovorans]CAH1685809.1 hypothetical protein CHELA17_64692 [Chelatococcus asaccharovorans]